MQPILFTLNRISQTDIPALQYALRAANLLQPTFMQQRPKALANLLAPSLPANLPWDANGLPGLVDIRIDQRVSIPRVVHEIRPYPPTNFKVSGIVRDASNVPMSGVTVHLFQTSTDVLFAVTTTDANGYYQFLAASPSQNYYAVAYKALAPDVAGTTVNTLVGT